MLVVLRLLGASLLGSLLIFINVFIVGVIIINVEQVCDLPTAAKAPGWPQARGAIGGGGTIV